MYTWRAYIRCLSTYICKSSFEPTHDLYTWRVEGDGHAHAESHTVTRWWAMGVREVVGNERQGSSIRPTEEDGNRVLRYTVVGRILICGVGFGDGVLEPSTPDHPLSWSYFSVSPEHPAGSRTSSGEDASCVMVQSAASREIVVGLNVSGRGATKEGMANA